MYDHFVSYASAERDRARAVAAGLAARRRQAWVDDSSPDDQPEQLVGLPAGQEHWALISAAIEESATFLVLDSPRWRQSEYCRRELEHARASGARIAVLRPPGDDGAPFPAEAVAEDSDLDALLDRLAPGDAVAGAHTRLRVDLRDGRTTPVRGRALSRVLGVDGRRAADAELVTTADLARLGLRLDESTAEHARAVLLRARRRRRRTRGGLAAVLVVLLALAGVAVTAGVQRVADLERAAEAADRASSLELAQQAAAALSTASALRWAQEAVDADDNTVSRGALAAATQEARYRTRMLLPATAYRGVAVSEDGGTVLAVSQGTAVVAHPDDDTSRTFALPETASTQVVLTADGSRGYLRASSGTVLCVDTATAVVTTSARSASAIALADDDRLWWSDPDGTLRSSDGCPREDAAAVLTLPAPAAALVALPVQRRITAVDDAGLVTTWGWDGADPARARMLTAVDVTEVVDPTASRPAAVDPDQPSWVQHCGQRVHVAVGLVGPLRSSTHVVLDLDGVPAGPRTSNTYLPGLACAPQDGAWSVPALTTDAVALPEGGYQPSDVADQADAGAAVHVASSARGGREVVLHPDGRLAVLDPDRAPWTHPVGDTVVALPLTGGTLLVHADGALDWDDGTSVRDVGELAGDPDPEVALTADRGYVPVGASVVEVGATGVLRSWTFPARVGQVSLATDGAHLVVDHARGAAVLTLTDGGTREVVDPDLGVGDRYAGHLAAEDGESLLLTTSLGRVLRITPDGEVLATVDVGVAGPPAALPLPGGRVLVIGQDGVLRTLDHDLRSLDEQLFGAGGIHLRASADGGTVLLSTSDITIWVLDAATLTVRAVLPGPATDVRLALPAPDGSSVVRVGPAEGTDPATLTDLPT